MPHLRLFIFFILASTTLVVKAQQRIEKFIQETEYLLYLPDGYTTDTSTRWPLLLFLHGSGESGTDIEKVKLHGPPELAAKGKKFPMIIVSPQSEVPWGWDVEMLYKMLQDLKRRYRVDENRVYLTGLSMGGFGTFSLAAKYPDEFAAIAPVCGGGDSSAAWKLRRMSVWCFHGAKDDVVPPAGSENMVMAARKYNPGVRYTLYPDANHNSWDLTYNNDSLYTWLLSQRKFRYSEKPIAVTDLKKLVGYYAGNDKDTVQIQLSGSGLVAKPPHETIPLKHAGNNVFFIDPAKGVELRFSLQNNTATSFMFMGNDRVFYRKVR